MNPAPPTSPATDQSTRRRRRPFVLAMALLAALGVGAGQLSLAMFTDQETVDATFAAGSIDLDGTKIAALSLSVPAIMPGDTITDDVVVHNVGSAELRYAMTTASTNTDGLGLRTVLTVTVKTVDVTTPAAPCDDFDGTTLVATTALGASSGGFGSTAAGDDSGDRTLAAADQETLCVRVALPLATGAAFEGAATTTTFTFDAEQTANNP
jgi:predicted ribosomally synthesized peptide with SipW-like signal peptide